MRSWERYLVHHNISIMEGIPEIVVPPVFASTPSFLSFFLCCFQLDCLFVCLFVCVDKSAELFGSVDGWAFLFCAY